ncbi:sulfocyanin-like copper-binding protein [Sulfuracidifex metallicus]|uniref:Quinol oxidase subunit 2 n=1 Tax=Sulfuracidifex metallicus DSM 6482 = JCM 9184 TaxID=523847 RepID=A0A6A9QYF2_SULME|nr:sulfocyanin-like copper-binding protein [Sulfuracidifex metallicus]MUN30042.1 quinol oxidase subunit 2 [Sulfuracidifex metallicus DSM 6482 = JCM 9184]
MPILALVLVLIASVIYFDESSQTMKNYTQTSTSSSTLTTSSIENHTLGSLPQGSNPLPYKGKEVFLHLVVEQSANNGVNFNGTIKGQLKVYVPAGWEINISLTDLSNLPHNLNVVKNDTPVPNSIYIDNDGKIIATVGGTPSTYSSSFIQPGSTAYTLWNSSTGVYWLACGFPGHAEMGMWAVLVVSNNITEPYYII